MAKKMSKGEDKKLLNIQHTCVLKVHIHCDGCQKKVKKLLQKIEGAYTTQIVADQGKVTVVGCVDSCTLINKLNKAGKHAVEWPTKGGNQKNFTNQPQNLQLDHAKEKQHNDNGKPQKGGGGKDKDKEKDHKGDHQQQQKQHQLLEEPQGKGLKDMLANLKDLKFPVKKDQKSVKFDVPSEDEDFDGDLGGEFFDEFEDEDDVFGDLDGSDVDDEDDDDFLDDPKMMKVFDDPRMMKGLNDKKGSGGGGNGMKGDQIQVAAKGGGSKNRGVSRDNKNGGGNKKGGNSHDGKNGGGVGSASSKNVLQPNNMGQGFHGMNIGQMGNMNQMGQFPTVQGLPAGVGGLTTGYYNGSVVPQDMMSPGATVGKLSPYQQQQYMQALLQQQQHQKMMNGQGTYRTPMGFGYGYDRLAYGPNVQSTYSMFSDEDPNSCSIL